MVYHTPEAYPWVSELTLYPRMQYYMQFLWLGKHSIMSEFTQPKLIQSEVPGVPHFIQLRRVTSTSSAVELSLHMYTLGYNSCMQSIG